MWSFSIFRKRTLMFRKVKLLILTCRFNWWQKGTRNLFSWLPVLRFPHPSQLNAVISIRYLCKSQLAGLCKGNWIKHGPDPEETYSLSTDMKSSLIFFQQMFPDNLIYALRYSRCWEWFMVRSSCFPLRAHSVRNAVGISTISILEDRDYWETSYLPWLNGVRW